MTQGEKNKIESNVRIYVFAICDVVDFRSG
jgi:hypothetical protein